MTDSEVFRQVAGVAAVFLLLAAVVYLLARSRGLSFGSLTGRRASGRHLEQVERLFLSPHHSLYLVRVRDRLLFISAAPNSTAIEDMGPAPVPGQPEPAP